MISSRKWTLQKVAPVSRGYIEWCDYEGCELLFILVQDLSLTKELLNVIVDGLRYEPKDQHDFLILWNRLVLSSRNKV